MNNVLTSTTATQDVPQTSSRNVPAKYDIPSTSWQEVSGPYLSTTVTTYYNAGIAGLAFEQSAASTTGQYSTPALENIIRYHDKKLNTEDDFLKTRIRALQVPYLDRIMANELVTIDREVARYQLAYMNTFLVSPFAGVVTAVYKEVGEAVSAGEPIVRVEDDTELFLVGRIQYRGVLKLGATAKLCIKDLAESGESLDVCGLGLVSIRGHNSTDDEWDVVFRVTNPVDKSGNKAIPLNYSFDTERTTVIFEPTPAPKKKKQAK